jgi:hypothetical protein
MTEHAAPAGAGGTVDRIDDALVFTARLLDTHPLALRAIPQAAGRFERLRHADRRYQAHEYFNRDWHPLYFADVARLFASAGLGHACPARLRDHLDALNLTDGQRRLLAEIPDPASRETARDFVTNTQIRRDYWVRDPQPLIAEALHEAWCVTRVVLAVPRGDVAERVTGPLGEQRLSEPVHLAVLAALRDHRPRTIHDIQVATGLEVSVLADAVFQLAAFGYVALAQDDATIARCTPRTERLNARLVSLAAASDDIAVLASPVTGAGVSVERIEQLFIGAIAAGRATSEEWAAYARKRATSWNEAELATRARSFSERRLPVMRALGVVP